MLIYLFIGRLQLVLVLLHPSVVSILVLLLCLVVTFLLPVPDEVNDVDATRSRGNEYRQDAALAVALDY